MKNPTGILMVNTPFILNFLLLPWTWPFSGQDEPPLLHLWSTGVLWLQWGGVFLAASSHRFWFHPGHLSYTRAPALTQPFWCPLPIEPQEPLKGFLKTKQNKTPPPELQISLLSSLKFL